MDQKSGQNQKVESWVIFRVTAIAAAKSRESPMGQILLELAKLDENLEGCS